MHKKTTDRRLQWLFATVLLFFGIFAASTRGPIASHVPQCAGARAIGAQTSLASATRESRPVAFRVISFFLVAALLRLTAPQLRIARAVSPAIRRVIQSIHWTPSLLRRPPPAISLA